MCLLSTFGLELERERRKGKRGSYYSLLVFSQMSFITLQKLPDDKYTQ